LPDTQPSLSPGWLPAAHNQGHTYRDRVRPEDLPAAAVETSLLVSAFYAARYRHSDRAVWSGRLLAGEIWRNGQQLRADVPLGPGDRLQWHRPPWQEPAVPVLPQAAVVFDDGDLLVLNKPSGLPVLPAGGFLAHTLLAQLERLWPGARPVHRLGRFTSGLLVCARRPATRAWLSAQLRDSTAVSPAERQLRCRKLYRALLVPGVLHLAPGEVLPIVVPIGRRPHAQLGLIWCAADGSQPSDRAARSTLTLLKRSDTADLVQVEIATGRPHQIRIHCAAAGAPLLGDPLYGPGGQARAAALPGDGGYQLQAWRLVLHLPGGGRLELEAPQALGL
jgi:23S rRNA pseudouridine1911/1915/1917 synthase